MLRKLLALRLRGLMARFLGRQGRKGKGTLILLLVLGLYCLGFFGFTFYRLFSVIAASFGGTDLGWYFFALMGLLAFCASFFLTAFAARGELFEARDTELLLSMPLRPRTILLSRLSALLVLEIGYTLIVFLPAGLAWFLQVGFDPGILALLLAGALILPLLALSLSSLLGWLLSLLTARVHHKAIFSTIFAMLFMVVYFYFVSSAQNYLLALVSHADAIASALESWALPFVWLGRGILGDLGAFAGFTLVALALSALTIWLLSRNFLHLATGGASRRKKSGLIRLAPRRPGAALRHRELRRILSSPTYLLNSSLGALMLLLAAVFLLVKMADARQLLAELMRSTGLPRRDLCLGTAVMLGIFASMHCVTAPSVSLEGPTLWILRASPAATRSILTAKLWLSEVLGALPMLVLSLALAITLRADPVSTLLLLLAPQLYLLLAGALGLFANLLLPRLNWVNEAQPVKQSAAVAITMFGLMIYFGLAIAGLFLLDWPLPLYFGLFLGLTAGITAFFLCWIYTAGCRRFEAL